MKTVWLAPALLVLLASAAATQPAENYPTPRTRGAPPSTPDQNAAPRMDHGAQKEPQGAVTHDTSHAVEKGGARQGLSDEDKNFLAYVAKVNRAEIQLCRYAAQKTASPEVRAFAEHMIHDHSAVAKQLAGLSSSEKPARAHHVVLHARRHAHHAHFAKHKPSGAPRLGKEAEEMAASLKDKRGADFDKAFMSEQVDYHTKPVAAFDKEIKDTGNSKVRDFAKGVGAAFKGHLDMAKSIESKPIR